MKEEAMTDQYEKALREYEAAHEVWMNTSVFSEAGQEAKRVKDEARKKYETAMESVRKTQPVVNPEWIEATHGCEPYKPNPQIIGERWLQDSSLEKWFPITAEQIVSLEKSKAALSDALREVMSLVNDGDLVRNTESDHDAAAFLRQGLKITRTLQKAQTALSPC